MSGDSEVTPLGTCPGSEKDISIGHQRHIKKCIPYWTKRCENDVERAKIVVNGHIQTEKKSNATNYKKRKPKASTRIACKSENNVVKKAKSK